VRERTMSASSPIWSAAQGVSLSGAVGRMGETERAARGPPVQALQRCDGYQLPDVAFAAALAPSHPFVTLGAPLPYWVPGAFAESSST
jgi:hypothetical protein